MKYIIDIPKNIVAKIKKWTVTGKYESVSEFIRVAAENQTTIEESYGGEAKITPRGPKKVYLPPEPEEQPLTVRYPKLLSKIKDPKKIQLPDELPDESKIWSGWLWGQYHKIFPIKLSLRMLANMVARSGTPSVNLREARKKIAEVAREIGLALRDVDKLVRRAYGEKYSVGLPTSAKKQRSLSRYEQQYVGYMMKDGRLGGAPADLRFVNIQRGKKGEEEIGLTEPGKTFALLENPLIDKPKYDSSLSEKEKTFYINHVLKKVSGEADALRTVLRLVKQGINTPKALNKKIGKTKEAKKRGWSQAVINTMRAGAVGRFRELGLLARKKDGVRTTYLLAEEGEKYAL